MLGFLKLCPVLDAASSTPIETCKVEIVNHPEAGDPGISEQSPVVNSSKFKNPKF